MKKTLGLSFCILSSIAIAADEPNYCQFLSVMINNRSPLNCELIAKDIKAGQMSSSTQVPGLISSGSSSYPFEMRQLFYGPDIVLTYKCGEKRKITFESQQDICIFSAGNITGIIHELVGLSAKHQTDQGSMMWNRHGAISWTIY